MQIVPLNVWYPAMAAKWTGTAVPRSEREAWVIHHTAGGTGRNPLSYARSVADAHYLKWGVPGGYQALVGTDGIVREMCGLDRQGVHSGTHYWNRHGLGLAFQGDFMEVPPPEVMLDAAVGYIAQIDLDQTWHRAVRPTYTDCPGDALIALLPLEDDTVKPPDWARTATQWHIDRGIYSGVVDDIDEDLEFHRQTVFRHRFYNAIRGEFGGSGGSDSVARAEASRAHSRLDGIRIPG
jgi:hypothetical protein